MSLLEIARKYGTDKCDTYDRFPAGHNLVALYESLFPNPERVKKVLEIGIGYAALMGEHYKVAAGASLFMWEDYFPNADIYALDNREDALVNRGRIRSWICDQGSAESLDSLLPVLGTDFDLIVDDGSHQMAHQILTARKYVPLLAKDGVYVLEDIHSHQRKEIKESIPYSSEYKEFFDKEGRLGELALIIKGEERKC